MSKAVVCTGREREFEDDEKVNHVAVADELEEIGGGAFDGCTGLKNLNFLEGSTITTIGGGAFAGSGVITLQGVEGVRQIGSLAFAGCKSLRTIEGLGLGLLMGSQCFAYCTLLKSMKGWPASMTVIPGGCFRGCTGMTTVDCDLAHVTSVEVYQHWGHAFAGCTSLLPPSLSASGADPAAVLTYLKEKSRKERARPTFLCSLKHAQIDFYNRTGDPCGASRRIIMEFAGLFPA
jgi:hypothetical protein